MLHRAEMTLRFAKTKRGFDEMKRRFVKMKRGFDEMKRGFVKMKRGFVKMRRRFVKMRRGVDEMKFHFGNITLRIAGVRRHLRFRRLHVGSSRFIPKRSGFVSSYGGVTFNE